MCINNHTKLAYLVIHTNVFPPPVNRSDIFKLLTSGGIHPCSAEYLFELTSDFCVSLFHDLS